jgi:multisubunit Na+/H+ antiporter MnhG subunit
MRKFVFGIITILVVIGLIVQSSAGIRWLFEFLLGSLAIIVIVVVYQSYRARPIKKGTHRSRRKHSQKVVKFARVKRKKKRE